MSVLQYPDGISPKDVQIWNNAAFDSHDNNENSSKNKPILIMNSIDCLDSFSSKENQSPSSLGFNSSVSSINLNGVLEISKANSKRVIFRGLKSPEVRDEKEIDKEIEEIEMEMKRLASRLESLRILKAQKSENYRKERKNCFFEVYGAKTEPRRKEENVLMSSKSKLNSGRGRSLGPVEIVAGSRRGMSLGPSEIGSGIKSKQFGKQDSSTTPIQPIQNRRKSCFWKLEDIDEEKETKGKGKVQVIRQAVTTIGSKKSVKKDDGVIGSVQPKKLFENGEKTVFSASAKKSMKHGRVVASRYNQGKPELFWSCKKDHIQITDIGETVGDVGSVERSIGSSTDHHFPQISKGFAKSVSRNNGSENVTLDTDSIKRYHVTRRKKQKLNGGVEKKGPDDDFTPPRRDMGSQSKWKERTDQVENVSFPTSFEVTMKTYNVEKYILHVPKQFARLNIPHSTSSIKLLDGDDNEWVVSWICEENSYNLIGGWICQKVNGGRCLRL
ncbi:hypothetical protein LIER_40254 [Lithospermum erythrorhizon]|uniref:B3 domain-containing protein n=1 Tax=Lithospermum erythrorhizon TaxID=34254 RepID=A0AAV3QU80_LITER